MLTDEELVHWLTEDQDGGGGAAAIPLIIDEIRDAEGLAKIVIVPKAHEEEMTKLLAQTNPELPYYTSDVAVIDLAHLALKDGASLPPLILRNCLFLAPIDISGSHFASFELDECESVGLIGINCRVEGSLRLRKLKPPAQGGPPCDGQPTLCRVRLSDARIGGVADFCGSKLAAELFEPDDRLRFADQFALALDGATIDGRVVLADNFIANGGVTLFQSHIGRDLFLEDAELRALRPGDDDSPRNDITFAALDAKQAEIGTGLIWRGDGSKIYGRIELDGAKLGGDLRLLNLKWDGEHKNRGGIDCRRTQIIGQVYVDAACKIARRSRTMRGLQATHEIGVALDFWKARIERGILIEKGATLYGAIQLNQSRVEHQIAIDAEIELPAEAPANSKYHVALDLTDATLNGNMRLALWETGGRVSLERMTVNGSVDLFQLAFTFPSAPCLDDQRENAPRTSGSSLLDLQDLRVSGGINIRRNAVSVVGGPPDARYVVDLRGMCTDSWDDAEATCWDGLVDVRTPWLRIWLAGIALVVAAIFAVFIRAGLITLEWGMIAAVLSAWVMMAAGEALSARLAEIGNQSKAPRKTYWRLRFDGMTFNRLDSSSQGSVTPESVESPWRRKTHWFTPRNYRSLGQYEAYRLRRASLDSYHDNRVRSERKGWVGLMRTTAIYGPVSTLYRWTLDASWRRRERIGQFSPHAFEAFARAYMMRGDLDIATRIMERRLSLLWRKRARDFTRYFFQHFWIAAGFVSLIALASSNELMNFAGRWVIIIASIVLTLPALAFWSLKIGFGFGVRTARALTTGAVLALLGGLAVPVSLEGPQLVWAEMRCMEADRRVTFLARHFLYGVDRMVPGLDADVALYRPRPNAAAGATGPGGSVRAAASICLHEPIEEGVDGHVHSHPIARDRDARRLAWLELVIQLIGWIVVSAIVITLSGFVRRDIERQR